MRSLLLISLLSGLAATTSAFVFAGAGLGAARCETRTRNMRNCRTNGALQLEAVLLPGRRLRPRPLKLLMDALNHRRPACWDVKTDEGDKDKEKTMELSLRKLVQEMVREEDKTFAQTVKAANQRDGKDHPFVAKAAHLSDSDSK